MPKDILFSKESVKFKIGKSIFLLLPNAYMHLDWIIIIIIIIIITALQPFVGSWPLFQFVNPIHSR
jgi:hypothetical protein